MGFPFKKVLGTVAPFLTAALPGPFGGMALTAINGALGLKQGATVDDVSAAINSGQLTGDQMTALKEAELAFQAEMKKADLDDVEKLEAIAEQDRDSARQREIAVKDNTPKILAYAVTIGFFGLLAVMIFHGVPQEGHDLFVAMVGTLGTAWVSIITYYFGSSRGSDRKTELMAQAQSEAQ